MDPRRIHTVLRCAAAVCREPLGPVGRQARVRHRDRRVRGDVADVRARPHHVLPHRCPLRSRCRGGADAPGIDDTRPRSLPRPCPPRPRVGGLGCRWCRRVGGGTDTRWRAVVLGLAVGVPGQRSRLRGHASPIHTRGPLPGTTEQVRLGRSAPRPHRAGNAHLRAHRRWRRRLHQPGHHRSVPARGGGPRRVHRGASAHPHPDDAAHTVPFRGDEGGVLRRVRLYLRLVRHRVLGQPLPPTAPRDARSAGRTRVPARRPRQLRREPVQRPTDQPIRAPRARRPRH